MTTLQSQAYGENKRPESTSHGVIIIKTKHNEDVSMFQVTAFICSFNFRKRCAFELDLCDECETKLVAPLTTEHRYKKHNVERMPLRI